MCRLLCRGLHMATNLSIDPQLIELALKVSGERTKDAAVTKALQEFIARRRQKRLLDLMDKLEWDTSYDYKTARIRNLEPPGSTASGRPRTARPEGSPPVWLSSVQAAKAVSPS